MLFGSEESEPNVSGDTIKNSINSQRASPLDGQRSKDEDEEWAL